MRKLTYYELTVLIKNEVSNMNRNILDGGFNAYYLEERAKDILKYIEEQKSLEEEDI